MAARLRAARKLELNRCGRRNIKPQPLMKRTSSRKDSPLPRGSRGAREEKEETGERALRGEASDNTHPRFPFNPFVSLLSFIPFLRHVQRALRAERSALQLFTYLNKRR